MKIICNQSDLMTAINIALRAVPSKSTLQILECMILEAKEGKVKITTNNMELGIETSFESRIDVEGKVALNAKMFSEIIRKLPDSYITLETDDNNYATISSGSAKFKIAGLDGEDFPNLPVIEKEDSVKVSQLTLKDIIRQTSFCISTNEATEVMTGIHFEVEGSELTVSACDGHRIAIRKVELKESYDRKDVVIPGSTVNEIFKILNGGIDDIVDIYFTQNNILFEFGDTLVLSRLIEKKFLNVKQMISNDYDTKIKVNKKNFFNCFDRSTLLIVSGENIPVILKISDGEVNISLSSSIGSLNEEVDAEKEGNDLMIAFNPKYIMDVLKVIDDEEISIYMTNVKAPCFIRNEEAGYNYVVLPVNFSAPR